jgi:hypothetical protein
MAALAAQTALQIFNCRVRAKSIYAAKKSSHSANCAQQVYAPRRYRLQILSQYSALEL